MSEISNWIRLTATPGVGCEAAKKLLHAFGLPEQIFSASYPELKRVVSEKQAQALSGAPSAATTSLMERTEQWCTKPENHLITLADRTYPAHLLTIPDPPTVLYVKGNADLLSKTSVAVVGSRNATTQGVVNAREFSDTLSQHGLTIVSGLAAGIDAAAHQGGLAGSGSTIAVIGTGIDIVYPAANRELAHQIAAQGCIVSEYPLGTPPIASNFPRRNRIISGLAQGVLVVEAAAQSGSLITARMANEQGRDVFAIPGSIHSPFSKGCHLLIKQGAKLVDTAQDIIDELRIDELRFDELRQGRTPTTLGAMIADTANAISITPDNQALLSEMGFDPVHPDALALRCKLDCADLTARLVMLELEGHVEMLAGGLVRRLVH